MADTTAVRDAWYLPVELAVRRALGGDWDLGVAGEAQVRESVEVFAAWNWEDLENNSRTFAYSRATLETGVRAVF